MSLLWNTNYFRVLVAEAPGYRLTVSMLPNAEAQFVVAKRGGCASVVASGLCTTVREAMQRAELVVRERSAAA